MDWEDVDRRVILFALLVSFGYHAATSLEPQTHRILLRKPAISCRRYVCLMVCVVCLSAPCGGEEPPAKHDATQTSVQVKSEARFKFMFDGWGYFDLVVGKVRSKAKLEAAPALRWSNFSFLAQCRVLHAGPGSCPLGFSLFSSIIGPPLVASGMIDDARLVIRSLNRHCEI